MPDAAPARLGVIGLGAMGARIATRLVWEGFNPQVYDVVDIAVRMFTNDVGGMMSGSPKMMAQSCDVIITVLPSADALRDVLYGWEGLAGGFRPGGVVIDMGTSDPLATVDLAKQLAERGIDLIDAPALGTPADARAGKLTLIIGGDPMAGGTLPADLRRAGGAHAACRGARFGSGRRGARRFFARGADPCRQRGAAHRPAVWSGCKIGDRDRRDAERRWSGDGCDAARAGA